ncbi:MAG: ribosome silencing factor [Alphaproteobacteria bacterium]
MNNIDQTAHDALKKARLKPTQRLSVAEMGDKLIACLEEHKAEEITRIDLAGLTDIADEMLVATGMSSRHVGALGDYALECLKQSGWKNPNIEGKAVGDWVLIDAGDILIHLFKPEIRELYNIEKLWSEHRPNSENPEQPPQA